MHLPEEGLELGDLLHLLDLLVTALHDLLVLHLDHTALDEDRVLVVGGDRELRDLHLALLEVDDDLEVVLEFRDAVGGLLVEGESFLEFRFDVRSEGFEVRLVVFDLLENLCAFGLFFLELNTKHALRY